MFGSEILDVAIGLSLIYLLLSAMASALREALEAWFKTRGEHLERGIRELLQDPDGTWLARGVYEHPLVAGLYRGGYSPRTPGPNLKNAVFWLLGRSRLPSYIPAPNFAAALLDVVARGPVTPQAAINGAAPGTLTVQGLRAQVEAMGNPYLQRALQVALDRSAGDLNRAQANLEAWFNSAMDRVSGWYRRRTQAVLLGLGLVLAVGLNVNTITVANYLLRDNTAREALVAQAQAVARDSGVVTAGYDALQAKLNGLQLPIGWGAVKQAPGASPSPSGAWPNFWLPLLGWLLTAFAVSLGAPFWFDVLNKFIVIRSTVKPHEKSPEEASEDRQRPGSQQSSQRVGGPLPGAGGTGVGAGGAGGGAGSGGGGGGTPVTEGRTDAGTGPGGTDAGTGPGGTDAGTGPGGTPAAPATDGSADFEPHTWKNGPDEGEL